MFIKSAVKLLIVTLVGLSVIAATADAGRKLDNAIFRAIALKKQTKKIHGPNGHGFNIKKVDIEFYPRVKRYQVEGQLSHRRRHKTDDQYYYYLTVSYDGRITKYREKITRGGGPWKYVRPRAELGPLPSERGPQPVDLDARPFDYNDTSWRGDARKIVRQIARQVARLCRHGRPYCTHARIRDHRTFGGNNRTHLRDHRRHRNHGR